MIKQLKRWGNNLVITFTQEEEELYGLVLGDKINLDDMIVQKIKKKKKK